MYDLFGVAATNSVALSANVAKTVLQVIAPANHRVKILGWGAFFDGVSATNTPVRIRLQRQTTAGTMSALTPTKTASRAESLLVIAQFNATAEPSNSDIIEQATCHPQQGYEVKFAPGQELIIEGGGRVGIEILAVNAVNSFTKIFFEE